MWQVHSALQEPHNLVLQHQHSLNTQSFICTSLKGVSQHHDTFLSLSFPHLKRDHDCYSAYFTIKEDHVTRIKACYMLYESDSLLQSSLQPTQLKNPQYRHCGKTLDNRAVCDIKTSPNNPLSCQSRTV